MIGLGEFAKFAWNGGMELTFEDVHGNAGGTCIGRRACVVARMFEMNFLND